MSHRFPAQFNGQMNETAHIITAATALVAVIVGPIVSLWVARRQIRASVISANRQAWVNALRESIAEFLSQVNLASSIQRAGGNDEAVFERTQRIMQLNCTIDLLINPKESDHADLARLITEATNAMTGPLGNEADEPQKWDERNRKITELSQRILKHEWERVKRGD